MAINVGQGTIIKMTISSSLTAITQVVEGEGGGTSVPRIKKTNLGDVAERARAGLPKGEPLSFTVQYDPTDATHEAMIAAVNSWPQPNIVFNVIYNTSAGTDKEVLTGFLSKFSPKGFNQEDNLEADIEIEIDGVGTFT